MNSQNWTVLAVAGVLAAAAGAYGYTRLVPPKTYTTTPTPTQATTPTPEALALASVSLAVGG